MKQDLRQKLLDLPDLPGVYVMRAADGEPFYIGKAKSLRDRMRNYLGGSDTRAFVALLDGVLADIEVVLTGSEKEALLLENELIKRHLPRFNVKLTDDSRYLCLRLDTRQTYPRLQLVRRFARDGARYFGPFHSAGAIRESVRLINRYFQLRTCSDQVLRNRTRPCLQYQIKRCPAPCVFDVRDQYADNIGAVAAFLEGRANELVNSLEARMQRHAEQLQYELAAQVRDQLKAVRRSLERQQVVNPDWADRDVVGLYREGPEVEINVMRTREGRLIEARRLSLCELEQPVAEILADFVARFYSDERQRDHLPDEILLPLEIEMREALGRILSEGRKRQVRIMVPVRGDKRRLVMLADRNAKQAFTDKQRQRGAAKTSLDRLQRALRLRVRPDTIECVDISHLQGTEIVASVVRFEMGVPARERYRHYRVRTTDGQDDFKSIYEVVGRRARRGLEEGDLPALLVIDGGKGQLAAARAALDDHGVDGIELIGLAKSRVKEEGGEEREAVRSPERIFFHGRKDPIVLRQNSAELFVLTHARDEAHRFAITFQRKRRRKAATRSALDGVEGIGPQRRRKLLKTFGSVAGVKAASMEELAEVVGEVLAKRLWAHFTSGLPLPGSPP